MSIVLFCKGFLNDVKKLIGVCWWGVFIDQLQCNATCQHIISQEQEVVVKHNPCNINRHISGGNTVWIIRDHYRERVVKAGGLEAALSPDTDLSPPVTVICCSEDQWRLEWVFLCSVIKGEDQWQQRREEGRWLLLSPSISLPLSALYHMHIIPELTQKTNWLPRRRTAQFLSAGRLHVAGSPAAQRPPFGTETSPQIHI